VRAWSELKDLIAEVFWEMHDLLHVPFGLLIFLSLALLLRRRRHSLSLDLAVLACLQVVIEAFDGIQWWLWTGTVTWREALSVAGFTLALLVLLVGLVQETFIVGPRRKSSLLSDNQQDTERRTPASPPGVESR